MTYLIRSISQMVSQNIFMITHNIYSNVLESSICVAVSKQKMSEVNGHEGLRFKWWPIQVSKLIEYIEEGRFLYWIPKNVKMFDENPFSIQVHENFYFTEIIPFDVDCCPISMDEFIERLSPNHRPTLAYPTKDNINSPGKYRFRLLYLFNDGFGGIVRNICKSSGKKCKKSYHLIEGRNNFNNLYKVIYNHILEDTGLEKLGDDDDCYVGEKIVKAIRGCKSGDKVNVVGKIYQKGDFCDVWEWEEPLVEDKAERNVINYQDVFSEKLLAEIKHYSTRELIRMHWETLGKYLNLPKEQFVNGVAQVRGNNEYAEFPRKYRYGVKDEGKRYKIERWKVGDGRKRILRYDAYALVFNDIKANGKRTLSADEQFVILANERDKYFELGKDKGDVVGDSFVLDYVSEVFSKTDEEVIEFIKTANQKYDKKKQEFADSAKDLRTEIGERVKKVRNKTADAEDKIWLVRHSNVKRVNKRQICRVDYDWLDKQGIAFTNMSIKKFKHTARAFITFKKMLTYYDEHLSNEENCNIMKEHKSEGIASSISSIKKFKRQCKELAHFKYEQNDSNEYSLWNVVISDVYRIKNLDFNNYAYKYLTENEPLLYEKVIRISDMYDKNFWDEVREGKRTIRNGRKPDKNSWKQILTNEDVKMKTSELIQKVHKNFPNVSANSIRIWKSRKLKELAS